MDACSNAHPSSLTRNPSFPHAQVRIDQYSNYWATYNVQYTSDSISLGFGSSSASSFQLPNPASQITYSNTGYLVLDQL